MRVGLIDVDGYKGYPNFALMKISAYHKVQRHQVEWVDKSHQYDVVYWDMTGIKPYTDNFRTLVPFLIRSLSEEIKQQYPSDSESSSPCFHRFLKKPQDYTSAFQESP